MTLEELLAHNYEIVKRGDWIGFRISYTLQDDNTIRYWWEITRKDINKKDGLRCIHSNNGNESTGLFTTTSVRQYWERQLEWFYEVSTGLR